MEYTVYRSSRKTMSLLRSKYIKGFQLYGHTIYNDDALHPTPRLDNLSTSPFASLGMWWNLTIIYFDLHHLQNVAQLDQRNAIALDALLAHAMQFIK